VSHENGEYSTVIIIYVYIYTVRYIYIYIYIYIRTSASTSMVLSIYIILAQRVSSVCVRCGRQDHTHAQSQKKKSRLSYSLSRELSCTMNVRDINIHKLLSYNINYLIKDAKE